MCKNPRRGRHSRNFTANVLKILDLKSSSEQVFFENWRWVPLVELDVTSIYGWFEKGCHVQRWIRAISACHWWILLLISLCFDLTWRPWIFVHGSLRCYCFPFVPLQATLLPAKATYHLQFVMLCCFRYIVLQCNWKKKHDCCFFIRKRIRFFRVDNVQNSFSNYPR